MQACNAPFVNTLNIFMHKCNIGLEIFIALCCLGNYLKSSVKYCFLLEHSDSCIPSLLIRVLIWIALLACCLQTDTITLQTHSVLIR